MVTLKVVLTCTITTADFESPSLKDLPWMFCTSSYGSLNAGLILGGCNLILQHCNLKGNKLKQRARTREIRDFRPHRTKTKKKLILLENKSLWFIASVVIYFIYKPQTSRVHQNHV